MLAGSIRSPWWQIRRCHRCGHTCETRGARVRHCPQCSAQFAPFYFADTTPEGLLPKRAKPTPSLARQIARGNVRQYRPLVGIAEWWSEE